MTTAKQATGGGAGPTAGGLHLGIVMDGNARWADQQGLPRNSGYLAGYRNVLRVVEGALDLGVGYLTLFAFSTENWGRDRSEVRSLMALFTSFFRHDVPALANCGVRTRALGRLVDLPAGLRSAISESMQIEPDTHRLDLRLALAYGGRAEIADAVRRAHEAGDRAALGGDEAALGRYLYAPEVPPPDLIIRTGGQRRLSNFMLWQAAYSELWFSDALWPDFGRSDLEEALRDFLRRGRTLGTCHSVVAAGDR